jgi:hypothetical protein
VFDPVAEVVFAAVGGMSREGRGLGSRAMRPRMALLLHSMRRRELVSDRGER